MLLCENQSKKLFFFAVESHLCHKWFFSDSISVFQITALYLFHLTLAFLKRNSSFAARIQFSLNQTNPLELNWTDAVVSKNRCYEHYLIWWNWMVHPLSTVEWKCNVDPIESRNVNWFATAISKTGIWSKARKEVVPKTRRQIIAEHK